MTLLPFKTSEERMATTLPALLDLHKSYRTSLHYYRAQLIMRTTKKSFPMAAKHSATLQQLPCYFLLLFSLSMYSLLCRRPQLVSPNHALSPLSLTLFFFSSHLLHANPLGISSSSPLFYPLLFLNFHLNSQAPSCVHKGVKPLLFLSLK